MAHHVGGLLRLGYAQVGNRQSANIFASEQIESDNTFTEFKPCSPKDEQGFFVSNKTMKTKDLIKLGVPLGKPMDEAFKRMLKPESGNLRAASGPQGNLLPFRIPHFEFLIRAKRANHFEFRIPAAGGQRREAEMLRRKHVVAWASCPCLAGFQRMDGMLFLSRASSAEVPYSNRKFSAFSEKTVRNLWPAPVPWSAMAEKLAEKCRDHTRNRVASPNAGCL